MRYEESNAAAYRGVARSKCPDLKELSPGIWLCDVDDWGVELLPLVVGIADHCCAQQEAGTVKIWTSL